MSSLPSPTLVSRDIFYFEVKSSDLDMTQAEEHGRTVTIRNRKDGGFRFDDVDAGGSEHQSYAGKLMPWPFHEALKFQANHTLNVYRLSVSLRPVNSPCRSKVKSNGWENSHLSLRSFSSRQMRKTRGLVGVGKRRLQGRDLPTLLLEHRGL